MEADYCKYFESFLSIENGNDTNEKILDALLSVAGNCKANFKKNLKSTLSQLKEKYTSEIATEDTDDENSYFLELVKKTDDILAILYKDEL